MAIHVARKINHSRHVAFYLLIFATLDISVATGYFFVSAAGGDEYQVSITAVVPEHVVQNSGAGGGGNNGGSGSSGSGGGGGGYSSGAVVAAPSIVRKPTDEYPILKLLTKLTQPQPNVRPLPKKIVRPEFDLNGDGSIDVLDYSIFSYWYKNQKVKIPATVDFNHDRVIDIHDVSLFAYFWGLAVAPVRASAIAAGAPPQSPLMYWVYDQGAVRNDDTIDATLYLRASGAQPNAIESSITYDSTTRLATCDTLGSAITQWISIPCGSTHGSLHSIGLVRGAAQSDQKGDYRIAHFIFSPSTTGTHVVTIKNVSVGLQDVAGHVIQLPETSFIFASDESAHSPVRVQRVGTMYAVPLSVTKNGSRTEVRVGRNPDMFNNKDFVAFADGDGSGSSNGTQYYIQESAWPVPQSGKWVPVETPTTLTDDRGSSFIFVKSHDWSGSESTVRLLPRRTSRAINQASVGALLWLLGF